MTCSIVAGPQSSYARSVDDLRTVVTGKHSARRFQVKFAVDPT